MAHSVCHSRPGSWEFFHRMDVISVQCYNKPVHFWCKIFHACTAFSFYHLFSASSFPSIVQIWIPQDLLLPQWCFKKNILCILVELAPVGNPGMCLGILSDADPCTSEVRVFRTSAWSFQWDSWGIRCRQKLIFNSQNHCAFSFKSSFYSSYQTKN